MKKHKQAFKSKEEPVESKKLSIATQKRLEAKSLNKPQANKNSDSFMEVKSSIFKGPANTNFFAQAKKQSKGSIEILESEKPEGIEYDEPEEILADEQAQEIKRSPPRASQVPQQKFSPEQN